MTPPETQPTTTAEPSPAALKVAEVAQAVLHAALVDRVTEDYLVLLTKRALRSKDVTVSEKDLEAGLQLVVQRNAEAEARRKAKPFDPATDLASWVRIPGAVDGTIWSRKMGLCELMRWMEEGWDRRAQQGLMTALAEKRRSGNARRREWSQGEDQEIDRLARQADDQIRWRQP